MNINENYLKLETSYLFSAIRKKVMEYSEKNPDKRIIRLGIGDVTRPLVPAVVEAMQKATAEMGRAETFRGYGDEQGYTFLREAVCGYYRQKGVTLRDGEVFISDGAKSDIGNILDIFSAQNSVLVPNPVYPAYVDANVMAGREIVYMDGNISNNFLPMPDKNTKKPDIIYICSPNNPTGAVYTKEQLREWVEYALELGAVILFDSAYEVFVGGALPTSIFQIDGAKECAVEFGSLSKTAGFTGTRCGYTIIPEELVRGGAALNKMWLRRQTTKFNGVPYIVQRGAEAVFTETGLGQVRENIAYYLQNAAVIAKALANLGIRFFGGKNAPFIWLECPNKMSSWDFFDFLLENADVAGVPGAGFGTNGEGFFRLSAFGAREDVVCAMQRIEKLKLKL